MERPGPATILGLGLISAALLHLEITLTKIFSVVLWYHFGFLAIGVALLGFAAAGVYLTFRPKPDGTRLRRALARRALLAAAGIFVGFLLLAHSQFDTFSIVRERRAALLAVYLLEAALPFFLIGLVIAATIAAFPRHVGTLYASNLVGSAAGCLTAVIALNHVSGQQAVLAAVGLAGTGAALMGIPAGAWPTVRNAAVAGVLLFVGFRHTEALFRLLPIPSKMLASMPPEALEASDWSSLSKVDILAIGDTHQGLWGISDARFKDPWFEKALEEGFSPLPPRKAVLIDEWAITLILDPRGPFTRDNPVLTVLEYLPAGAVHRVKTGGSIVCIGAGGGLDLATALYFGQQRAVGVEINHVIVEAMKGRRFAEREYPAFSGQLYLDPRVEAVAAEGRHFLERTPEKFDIIQLSGVDTHSATEAGAFSLAENFLYTVEAFQAYFARLKPGGILTLTRWMLLRDGMPTQSLRLFTLACESLRRAGVADPGRHLYYFRSGIFAILLLSVEPFAPEALAALDGLVEAHGYDPLHRPHQAEPDAILIRRPGPGRTFTIPNLYQRYLEALATGPAAVAAFHADYPFNVAPPTDDRPFFFEDHKFESLWRKDNLINPLGGLSSHATLALLFLGALVAGYGFLCAPLRRLSSLGIGGAPRSVVAAYFGAIGLAYLLVEIPLSQRFILFLGQPAHALTVILFSLLVFSGLGSFVAGRLGRGLAGKAALASLLAAALAVVLLLALPAVLATCLGLALPARVAISVGLLAPLGFLMGFPFPLGIRLMESSGTGAAVPWAWAMNGYASVLASVGAVILGITWGFTTAVLIAAACYVAAAAIAPALGRGGTAAGSGSG